MRSEPECYADAIIEIGKLICHAQEFYGRQFTMPEVLDNLRGRTAGQFVYNRRGLRQIRVNIKVMSENYHHYLTQTIPHEVAHLVAHELHGYEIQSHGYYWQDVMVRCFNLPPDRCHNYKTEKARKVNRFAYVCSCKDWKLTSIRHNKQQTGRARYYCPKCSVVLRLKE